MWHFYCKIFNVKGGTLADFFFCSQWSLLQGMKGKPFLRGCQTGDIQERGFKKWGKGGEEQRALASGGFGFWTLESLFVLCP